jgi:hypothetical protein
MAGQGLRYPAQPLSGLFCKIYFCRQEKYLDNQRDVKARTLFLIYNNVGNNKYIDDKFILLTFRAREPTYPAISPAPRNFS